jgi:hypothetical protein
VVRGCSGLTGRGSAAAAAVYELFTTGHGAGFARIFAAKLRGRDERGLGGRPRRGRGDEALVDARRGRGDEGLMDARRAVVTTRT